MIFDDLSPHSKKATAKTLLAISELCNSLVLHDLASENPEILTNLSLNDAKNGQDLIETLQKLNTDSTNDNNNNDEVAPTDNLADEISDPTEIKVEEDVLDETPEKIIPSIEGRTDRKTEPVENSTTPLPADQEIQEVDIPEAQVERLRTEGIPFDPLFFKGKKNSMFLGVTGSNEEVIWNLDSDAHLLVLGDTIGKESKVGKLLADYAFNNKQDIELRIINPKLGNTEYLNYRTGDKFVASTPEEAFKAIHEAKELLSARFQEHKDRNGLTLRTVKDTQTRVILWIEEINSYIPTDDDTVEVREKKQEALSTIHWLLRAGEQANVHLALKSSTNINYEGMPQIERIIKHQDFYGGQLSIYSNDSLKNNQVELPKENLVSYAWSQFPDDSENTVLLKRGKYIDMVYLMNSHRTSK